MLLEDRLPPRNLHHHGTYAGHTAGSSCFFVKLKNPCIRRPPFSKAAWAGRTIRRFEEAFWRAYGTVFSPSLPITWSIPGTADPTRWPRRGRTSSERRGARGSDTRVRGLNKPPLFGILAPYAPHQRNRSLLIRHTVRLRAPGRPRAAAEIRICPGYHLYRFPLVRGLRATLDGIFTRLREIEAR